MGENTDYNQYKQKMIREVMMDKQLAASEKQQKIMAINKSKTQDELILMINSKPVKEKVNNVNRSCDHYKNKNCSRFSFSCCDAVDPCRRCHLERIDENSCLPENVKVTKIICNECDFKQECRESCINCGIKFNKNHCEKCFLWTDVDIVHCDKCKMCLVGTNETLFHCDSCNACFQKNVPHLCQNFNLKTLNCGICAIDISTSQQQSYILQCKHGIHNSCLKDYLNMGNYRCPLCRKSLFNLKNQWDEIKRSIEAQKMPKLYMIKEGLILNSPHGKFKITKKINDEMYQGILLDKQDNNNSDDTIVTLNKNILENDFDTAILCNDCDKKSIATYHYLGLECMECKSFNTTQI
jgi:RING finger/CHY zinc finger protein 1